MNFGFHGKILKINLSDNNIDIEKKEENFYRKYFGGPGIGAYYALKEIPEGADPLGPDNALIIANTLLTASPGPSVMRYTICAKSPLTGGFGKSEAGGWWGPAFKKAGYDAMVVKGKADSPQVIFIDEGEVSLLDAGDLWGKTTKEVEEKLKARLGNRIRVLQIGPGGENQVLYANICNDLAHFNGRNGMGAVMGSKNLKAVVVKGTGKVKCHDEENVKDIMKWFGKNVMKNPLTAGLHETGTAGGVTSVNAGGSLPTNNWQEQVFSDADKIGSEAMEKYLIKRTGCYGCPVRCKRVVKIESDDINVDPAYGGPEYETLVSLGSNCGINDIKILAKANELCNKYTIDTISFGMTLSFAMHCYQEDIITEEDTGGYKVEFGNNDIILPLIELTAKKEGFGKLMAIGSARMAEKLGNSTEEFLREVKNQEIPMHDPRVKTGLGLQFALSNNGADHWAAQHDPFFNEEGSGLNAIKPLGIIEPIANTDLTYQKVRFYYYTNLMTLMYDCLGTCVFGVVARGLLPLDKYINMLRGVTGWQTSLWEMLKVGERTSNMMRLFNTREGFTKDDDKLPELFYEDINKGPLDGKNAINREKFAQMIEMYYQMVGWDKEGIPTETKLKELDIKFNI